MIDPGEGTLLFPVDFPFVSDETLRALKEKTLRNRILIPTFEGRRGHPPLFGSTLHSLLLSVPIDEGARGVYKQEPGLIEEIETTDPGVLLNVNRIEDWERGLVDRFT